tara:strand:+ start:6804 stop:6980 length:177 start_codon:yes stop_codon:yes gene_type:complete
MNKDKVEITKSQFERYVDVQNWGVYNMLDPTVRDICNLTKKEHKFIVINYNKLKKKYT